MKRLFDWLQALYYRKTSFAWLLGLLAGMAFVGLGPAVLWQQLGVLAWKVLLIGVAVILAHGVRRQLWHYVDLSQMLSSGHKEAGEVFLGLCIFYAAFILAFLSGL